MPPDGQPRPGDRTPPSDTVAAAELRRALATIETLFDRIGEAEAVLQDLVRPGGLTDEQAISRFWEIFDTAPFRAERREAVEVVESLRALLTPTPVAASAA